MSQTRRIYAESLSDIEAQTCLRPRSEPDASYRYARRDAPPHGSLWSPASSRPSAGRHDVQNWDSDVAKGLRPWRGSLRRCGSSQQMAPARDRAGETQRLDQDTDHSGHLPHAAYTRGWRMDHCRARPIGSVHSGWSEGGSQYGPAFLDRISSILRAPPSYSTHSLHFLLRDPRLPPLCLVLDPWYPHHHNPVILFIFASCADLVWVLMWGHVWIAS